MKPFLDKDFLLETETAKILYHDYAEDMPIFDYHCHIPPKDIYEDRKFRSLTEVFLVDGHAGDHYKWRAMRQMGVPENYITGDKSDKEKFMKYAEMIPYAIGNPLYHWTHLELKKYFGITETLSPATAGKIYDECNKKLETLSARKFIEMCNVKTICTTDDPADSLEYHLKMREDKTMSFKVFPAFRPDKAVNVENTRIFKDWLKRLETTVGYGIGDLATFKRALSERVEFFDKAGCFLSDHSLEVVMFERASEKEAEDIFKKALAGEVLSEKELAKYKGNILVFFGRLYNKYGWAQQYHIGALRNNSKKAFEKLGADTGFDSINDSNFAPNLSAVLSSLEETNELPKTILYCLNPRDNEVIATLINCFQSEGIAGKIQFGSGWWFNDQKSGMEKQMDALSSVALISKFVGMLTDSRSFMSYPRHEYFRRILCNRFGNLIERGEYPCDIPFVGKIVQDICYNNSVNYFKK